MRFTWCVLLAALACTVLGERAGEYQNAELDSCAWGTAYKHCETCPAGTFSHASKSKSCTQCSPGSYQPEEHATGCIGCEQGKFQPAKGQSGCDWCPAGTFMLSTGDRTSVNGCQNARTCEQDHFVAASVTPSTDRVCSPCPTGKFQQEDNQLGCYSCRTPQVAGVPLCANGCPEGTHTGDGGCVPCEAGKFQDEIGEDTCKNCPAAKFSYTKSTACVATTDCSKRGGQKTAPTSSTDRECNDPGPNPIPHPPVPGTPPAKPKRTSKSSTTSTETVLIIVIVIAVVVGGFGLFFWKSSQEHGGGPGRIYPPSQFMPQPAWQQPQQQQPQQQQRQPPQGASYAVGGGGMYRQ